MSIKLSKTLRAQIVEAIMADVPVQDFRKEAEELLRSTLNNLRPDWVKKIKGEAEARLSQNYRSVDYFDCRIRICIRGGADDPIPTEVTKRIEELSESDKSQWDSRKLLRNHLSSVLEGFTTADQLKRSFPEFEKYLPTPVKPTPNLPAVTNTVAELMKAGWPKR